MRRLLLLSLALATAFAQSPARPAVRGVSHIALYSADIAKSRAFYTGFLGFEEPYELKNQDGSLAVAFFKINEGHYVELFPEKAARTDRLNHVSLEVPDGGAGERDGNSTPAGALDPSEQTRRLL